MKLNAGVLVELFQLDEEQSRTEDHEHRDQYAHPELMRVVLLEVRAGLMLTAEVDSMHSRRWQSRLQSSVWRRSRDTGADQQLQQPCQRLLMTASPLRSVA